MRNKQRLDRIELHVDNRRLHSSDLESLWPPLEAEFEAVEPMALGTTYDEMEEMIDQAAAQLDTGDREAFAEFMATDSEERCGVLPDDPSDPLHTVVKTELLVSASLALRIGWRAVTNHHRHRGWLR